MYYVRVFYIPPVSKWRLFVIPRRRSRSITTVDIATSNMKLKKINTKVEAYQSCKQKIITPTNCTTVIGVENSKRIS